MRLTTEDNAIMSRARRGAHHFEIGDRVFYSGHWGSCTGTIQEIHPSWHYRDADNALVVLPAKPVVKVDTLPKRWPYDGEDTFCPDFECLSPLNGDSPSSSNPSKEQ